MQETSRPQASPWSVPEASRREMAKKPTKKRSSKGITKPKKKIGKAFKPGQPGKPPKSVKQAENEAKRAAKQPEEERHFDFKGRPLHKVGRNAKIIEFNEDARR